MASIVELTDKQGNVLLPTTVADAVQVGDKTLSEFAESSASNSYDVEEDGFYFVDSEGNIGAKIDTTGFNTTNVSGGSYGDSSGGSSSGSESSSDLIVIDY